MFRGKSEMKSKYVDLKTKKDWKLLEEPIQAIQQGELVIFPTETVYGVGANCFDEQAVEKIYKAKGRKSDNPLIVHIANFEMLSQVATNISEIEMKLMKAFCPGPFTIILPKQENIAKAVTMLDTVGVRMPSNEIAIKLIEGAGVPIAAPSANISGKPSGTRVEDIKEELGDKVACIIDAGMVDIGLESTVVRVIEDKVKILRPGKITKEEMEKVVGKGNVLIDEHVLEETKTDEPVLSPGMKYRHYAPETKCALVYGKEENVIKKIQEIGREKEILVICKNRNKDKYNTEDMITMGDTLEEIAHNIFRILREVDKYQKEIVLIEGVEKEGLGLAIYNRLLRACEFHIINC